MEYEKRSLGSILLLPEVYRILKTIKIPKTVLSNLRTISHDYYSKFNPIYLKRKKPTLVVNYNSSTNSPLKLKQRYKLNIVDRVITNEELTNQSVPRQIFRHLLIEPNIWSKNVHLEIPNAISQLYPYITTLSLYFNEKLNGQMIGEFINQFHNLQDCEIILIGSESKILKELIVLSTTIVNPNIHITIEFYNSPLFERNDDDILGTLGSLALKLSFTIYEAGYGIQPIERMKQVLTNYATLKNKIKFGLTIFDINLRKTDQLERITQFCVQYQKVIQHLDLQLTVTNTGAEINAYQRASVTKCLTQLSPIITALTCRHIDEIGWDYLNPSIPIKWSKLQRLEIIKYNFSLEILKNCPKLQKLYLAVNLISCVFHNVQNTIEEDLIEYFGNLKRLRQLNAFIFNKEQNDKFNESCLRNILPNRSVRISSYWSGVGL